MAEIRLNLSNVHILAVDSSDYSLSLLRQMLRGFGARSTETVASITAAQEYLASKPVDLCIVEARLEDGSGFDLIRWMRRQEKDTIRFMPVLMLTGYSEMRNVAEARDCGANILVKKPISPQTLFDHIAWCAAAKRTFLQSSGYVGPDRRFKSDDAPEGPARRATDTQPDVAGEDTGESLETFASNSGAGERQPVASRG